MLLLGDVLERSDLGELVEVRLQEHVAGGGVTDIEVQTTKAAVILEAKVGWTLPTRAQLEHYTPRLDQANIGGLLVVSECTQEYVSAQDFPTKVAGVHVVYRSWPQIVRLAESCGATALAEKRLIRELTTYLRGLMTMQNQTSNIVHVVALGAGVQPWSAPFTPIELVTEKNRYFHPVGGGYPKEPQNYLGFRWQGKLQQIRHVEDYEVFTNPKLHIPEMRATKFDSQHYLYHLGPPILPPKEVRTGKLYRAQAVKAAIDLLLTCDTISDARDRTKERLAAVGEQL
jgi:hypothetical protein